MRKIKRKFTAQEKVSILRRHFLDKVTVSAICDEFGIAPTQFYRWEKHFLENAAAVFERTDGKKSKAEAERVAYLEAKPVLSAIERENRAVARIVEAGMHSPENSAVDRGRAAHHGRIRRALQQRAAARASRSLVDT